MLAPSTTIGMFDITIIVAYFGLQLLERVILGAQ
jgi:uncharacterized protein YggT (Ycf19 family)